MFQFPRHIGRTHAVEIRYRLQYNIAIPYFWASVQSKVNKIRKKHTFGRVAIRALAIEMTGA